MELPRQKDDGKAREKRQNNPAADRRLVGDRFHHLGIFGSKPPELRWPVEEKEDDVDARGADCQQLDDRLHRDRQDQSVLMFRRIGVARAEHDGEACHHHRHDEGKVEEMEIAAADAIIARVHHRRDRTRDRFQLERDIGNGADQRDDRHDHGNGRVLAITRRDEVRDRGQFLGLRQFHDTPDDGHSQREGEDRAGIDAEKFKPAFGGKTHATKIGPGCAIDRKAERVDDRPPLVGSGLASSLAVAVTRYCKEQQNIGESRDEYDPPRQQCSVPSTQSQEAYDTSSEMRIGTALA